MTIFKARQVSLNDEKYVARLRELTGAPVLYWCWDPMVDDYPVYETGEWHLKIAKAADLYLSGELGHASFYHKYGIRFYYFQFDSVSKEFEAIQEVERKYDVVFMGSSSDKRGRLTLLKEINKQIPIQVFAYDQIEWIKQGFKSAQPAVYGHDFARVVSQSKIVLGLSYDPHCFGYWSNRVGKVLYAGGFLLQQYTPGMESFLGDSAVYFSTSDEAIMRIKEHLALPERIAETRRKNTVMNRSRWTSQYKVRQLVVMMKRFLIEDNGRDWRLP